MALYCRINGVDADVESEFSDSAMPQTRAGYYAWVGQNGANRPTVGLFQFEKCKGTVSTVPQLLACSGFNR
jgi:hypothetical protein